MTGRFVLILMGALIAAWLAASSNAWLAALLAAFVLLAIRWDYVATQKHYRRMRQERMEPTVGRRR